MRILRVHNRYKDRGGEDAVFEQEIELLAKHGNEVDSLEFDNSCIEDDTWFKRGMLAFSTIWSTRSRRILRSKILQFRPEITHFDNTFPLISPSAYSICRSSHVAVVQTLHNYRLVCPAATLFRDGHPCEDCVGKILPYPGIWHGCYRGSRMQSGTVGAMIAAHRIRNTWDREVDRYIALTQFSAEKLINAGIPADRISIKPNFVPTTNEALPLDRNGFLFVGRLAAEKGIETLLSAWSSSRFSRLAIVGDGPLRDVVEKYTGTTNCVDYLGQISQPKVLDLMATSHAVIVPSEWYEPFGLVVIEAFANSTPVIAARSGGLSELVSEGETGLLFRPGSADDLSSKVQWATEHPVEMRRMGENARREYEAKYTPERNYEILMDIYRQAIDHSRRKNAY